MTDTSKISAKSPSSLLIAFVFVAGCLMTAGFVAGQAPAGAPSSDFEAGQRFGYAIGSALLPWAAGHFLVMRKAGRGMKILYPVALLASGLAAVFILA